MILIMIAIIIIVNYNSILRSIIILYSTTRTITSCSELPTITRNCTKSHDCKMISHDMPWYLMISHDISFFSISEHFSSTPRQQWKVCLPKNPRKLKKRRLNPRQPQRPKVRRRPKRSLRHRYRWGPPFTTTWGFGLRLGWIFLIDFFAEKK